MSLSPLFPLFFFLFLSSFFSPILQLSERRPKRTKRQIRVKGENDVTHSNIIEPQAAVTLSSTPKKRYQLVSPSFIFP